MAGAVTSSAVLGTAAGIVELDVVGAFLRGGVSALVVTALLLAAQRWGRGVAGLLAGLPTVTGPAMVWLALDQGSDFAEQAANGAVAAGVPCALFALTYAWLAPTHGRLVVLFCACGSCLLGLSFLATSHWPMHLALPLVAVTCTGCLALMPRAVPRAVAQSNRALAVRAGTTTALVSGLVSTLAIVSAQALGPQWAGVLTSPPVLAAAVALELHRQGCPARVQDFLRGYTAGLVGRSIFVAVFGALLASQGLAPALSAALTVALLLSWGTVAWMHWRNRLATIRTTTS